LNLGRFYVTDARTSFQKLEVPLCLSHHPESPPSESESWTGPAVARADADSGQPRCGGFGHPRWLRDTTPRRGHTVRMRTASRAPAERATSARGGGEREDHRPGQVRSGVPVTRRSTAVEEAMSRADTREVAAPTSVAAR
jgi:hypothetical protein